jgi:hypothetical protein
MVNFVGNERNSKDTVTRKNESETRFFINDKSKYTRKNTEATVLKVNSVWAIRYGKRINGINSTALARG